MPDLAGLGDLWVRFSRVCECCDVCVHAAALPPGWTVEIKRRGKTTEEPIKTTSDHLLSAMAAAVGRAEAKGY